MHCLLCASKFKSIWIYKYIFTDKQQQIIYGVKLEKGMKNLEKIKHRI